MPFAFLFLNLDLCVTSKASCPPGWYTSKTSRSCIKLFLSKKSWDDARKACQAQGADLLINYNKEKEKLIYEERDTLVGDAFWIGLNDRNREGDFTWLDERQKIINVHWHPDEPDNYQNRQHCVIVNKKPNKEAFLFDRVCSNANFFICEFSLDNISENACDRFTGSCISGCDEGYEGQRCDAQLCPPMWRASKTSRSCVKLFLSKKSWRDARKACQAHGADLLINYNQEKEQLIYEEKFTLLDTDCWIGLNDRNQEGDFNWLDNRQKITNVPWADGEPDNYRDREDCVGVRNQPSSGGVLFDRRCSLLRYFICELFTVCPKNTYGVHCSKTCSENCGGPENECDNFTGICTSGCDEGYQGERCEAECTNNTFGVNCSENCNQNCGGPNNTCDIRHGRCTDGCDDGYQGEKCEAPCEDNTFGADCSETCSKTCAGPKNLCNHVNGSCVFGCDDGYQGERCENFLHSKLEKHFLYSWMAIIASSIFVLGVLTCSIMSVAIQHSHKKPRSKSSFDREETMFRDSYPHGSSLVNETAGSLSHEEHSSFHVRFESHEKDSNVPPRSVLIRNHSNPSAASRSVEEFYEPETEPFDDSFPADSEIKDFESVK
ncbi:hypothetical protein RRG08_043914 [Elysia crispata]|uniref:C-type lectin domain-containing protein n=1 Tax=Elysia crispata TaxID=231223 RepID=A0AAE1ANX3_9GAST|nr:hypothetical protein RRG08_043914 [Elysia crispata]